MISARYGDCYKFAFLQFRHRQIFDDNVARFTVRSSDGNFLAVFTIETFHGQTRISRAIQCKARIVRHAAVGEYPDFIAASFDRADAIDRYTCACYKTAPGFEM